MFGNGVYDEKKVKKIEIFQSPSSLTPHNIHVCINYSHRQYKYILNIVVCR